MSQVVDKLRTLKQRVFPREPELPFPDTINIESSYACNLKCVMCPRHFEGVPQGMFSLDMFEKHLQPYIHHFNYVHLTGWGEPMMNRDLVEIVRRCREAGCWTCFTTNGLLLKESNAREFLDTNLELINISCDADNEKDYEYVRGKGTFNILMDRMDTVARLRKEMGAQTRLQWTFLMMRFNFEQLPGAIRLAAEKGFDDFHAKHMETATSREELRDALWNTGMVEDVPQEMIDRHDEVLEESRRLADELGIRLIIHPRKMDFRGMCLVKPITNLFVDFQGRVSSCCYLNPNDVRPYNTAEEKPKDEGIYGDLRLGDLMDFLEDDKFKNFQREWMRGEVPEPCRNCLQINRIHTTSTDKVSQLPENLV